MFNRKERVQLITAYGKDDALAMYQIFRPFIDEHELDTHTKAIASEVRDIPCHLSKAICFIDYCYTYHKGNFDDLADWFNTLSAIQRQIERS